MESVKIARSRALKIFREKLGYAVLHLNSIVVGLSAVGSGKATKPAELSISWAPGNLAREETLARGFAIRSLMVTAYDALDHYLYDIADIPSPIRSEITRSILLRKMEHAASTKSLLNSDIQALALALGENKVNQHELRKALKEFTDKFCGKVKRPSIRRRLECLYEYCSKVPENSCHPQMPRGSYYSAVELLLAWRNVLVHDPETDQLGSSALNILRQDSEYFLANHAQTDIGNLIVRYEEHACPTLKDVSTLVSVLNRFVASIDAILIAHCDAESLFIEAINYENSRQNVNFNGMGTAEKSLRVAMSLAAPYGFVRSDAQVKKNNFKGVTFQIDSRRLQAKLAQIPPK